MDRIYQKDQIHGKEKGRNEEYVLRRRRRKRRRKKEGEREGKGPKYVE
jgi:hypothetical protein